MPIRRKRVKVGPSTVHRRHVQRVKKEGQPVNRNNKKPIYKYSTIKPIWKDETVYIVGGGPSLKDFDWNRLKGKKVIAINRAYEVLPFADVMYWTDGRFYKWYKASIDKFPGMKVTCRPAPMADDNVILIKSSASPDGLDMRPSFIAHGNNSGFGAINLAAKLGATKIYLLGYDMDSKPTQTHWHSGYNKVKHNHSIYDKMMLYFDRLPGQLKKLKIDVWNANPKSRLKTFPRCTLDSALLNQPERSF